MAKTSFTVCYDGGAARDGSMDVRDLAPALLAIGQLFDAANAVLNGESAKVSVNVRATSSGSFEVSLDLLQNIIDSCIGFLTGEHVTAAINLKEIVFGSCCGLVWLVKRLKGSAPSIAQDVGEGNIRIQADGDEFVVPLELLRLYQDIAVRTALQKAIAAPLEKNGIDTISVKDADKRLACISKDESAFFHVPDIPDEPIIDDTRRVAFTIVSLAFKEDNKWRLNDGNVLISAAINDDEFLRQVDENLVSFSKGDILICEVRTVQSRTKDGLRTEHTVEKVIEHIRAPRQLTLRIDPPKSASYPTVPPAA